MLDFSEWFLELKREDNIHLDEQLLTYSLRVQTTHLIKKMHDILH